MSKQKFYICEICGNLIGMINSADVPLVCCGQEMTELVPNTVDASKEKHVPEVIFDGDNVTVKVGSVDHPMIPAHYIEFIYLQTENGGQRRALKPGNPPAATFNLAGEKLLAVYEYCNLHGLWMKEM